MFSLHEIRKKGSESIQKLELSVHKRKETIHIRLFGGGMLAMSDIFHKLV
jgi:hypothetical protein